jgi:hypothetical protein
LLISFAVNRITLDSRNLFLRVPEDLMLTCVIPHAQGMSFFAVCPFQ